MAEKSKRSPLTIFQKLDTAINNDWVASKVKQAYNNYNVSNKDKQVLFRTPNKEEYDQKLLQLRQEKLLANMWKSTNEALSSEDLNGVTRLSLLYRDVELMDGMPEIGSALDMVAEEATLPNDKGNIVNVYSNSERVKTILEDLFVNRLQLGVTASMTIRGMAKYGNMFYLLNIDQEKGVLGWRQLPVTEMSRLENGVDENTGMQIVATSKTLLNGNNQSDTDKVKFVWLNGDQKTPYHSWQIAHFRLLTDSTFLPYGTSYLNKARRHWRMLTLMEDMMLLYRLERSIERRVFKIFVGNIDEKDVPAFVDDIANQFKRTPIVDPMTGQLDLRKNLLSVSDDYFIPTRDPNGSNPIETLASAQNLTAMDDIKYVENKMFTALRCPRAFLNYDDSTAGDSSSLAMKDIRFVRGLNRIQQAYLEELSKIATIHLFIQGFEDDLCNFTLTMNNPSTQAEQLEIETKQKKIQAVRDAVTDPGGGIPIMSMQRAQREILKWSDKEIKENLQEIRLEKAIAKELEKTDQIIKRTKIFDEVDRIYGELNAKYQDEEGASADAGGEPQGGGDGGPMGGGGGMPMGDMGAEGEIPMDDASGADAMASGGDGGEAPMESKFSNKPLLNEILNKYGVEHKPMDTKEIGKANSIYNKAFFINEEFNEMSKGLKEFFQNADKNIKDDE